MPTLEEEQAPIDLAIVHEVVEALPASWRRARLIAEVRTTPAGGENHTIAINNPDGTRGVAKVSPKLVHEVRKLSMLFTQHAIPFKSVVYDVHAAGDGAWDFQAKYEYP